MSGYPSVCPRKFKFFRILLPGFTSKMSIPHEFVKYFIEENSTWATILSPLASLGMSRLMVMIEACTLQKVGRAFALAHKLNMGNVLVFKYEGGLVFDVTIFDQSSTCERDYRVTDRVANDRIPGQEKNCERASESLRKQSASSCGKRTAAVMMEQAPCKPEPDVSDEQVAQMQNCEAHEATRGGRRDSCFVLTIKRCHRYSLEIPANYGEASDISSIHQLLLRDPKGHLWPTKLVHRHHASHTSSSLGTGWRDFRVGNNLQDGDVCVFELIKEKNEMHVQIHRRGNLNPMKISEDESKRWKRPSHKKACTDEMRKGSRSLETSPQFMSTMVPSNLRRKDYMNIPRTFLSSVDFSAVREVILVDSTRQWPVKVSRRKTRTGKERVSISSGWKAFRDSNNVKVGDVCAFKFKSGMRKAIFQVEVIKSEAVAQ